MLTNQDIEWTIYTDSSGRTNIIGIFQKCCLLFMDGSFCVVNLVLDCGIAAVESTFVFHEPGVV